MSQPYMQAADVHAFIFGKVIYAIDPSNDDHVATLCYQTDGSCQLRFENGALDRGTYGFAGQLYWTRYETFRAGEKHLFYLERRNPSLAQAYHEDGSKAFLLSHLAPA